MKSLLDVHCHTVASGHAYSTVKEYAEEAAKIGLKLMAITDHAPKMPGSCDPLHLLNLKSLPEKICGVEVLTGVELNIMDSSGRVDLSEGLIKKLDVVIASLHIPCISPGSSEENTSAVINAMKNPLIKIIGHLGDPRYPMNIKRVVQAAKDTSTIIEINEVSLNPDNDVRKGGEALIEEIARECLQKQVPVILGSDSHFCEYIGILPYGEAFVSKLGFPDELVLNTSVERFKNAIKKVII